MELTDMQTSHFFLIHSDSSGHSLSLDGEKLETFPTLNDAETRANEIARASGATKTPRFELDFAWTLSDDEIRVAMLATQTPENMK